MTEPEKKPGPEVQPKRKRSRRARLAVFCALLAALAGSLLYLNSGAFQERMRRSLVDSLERGTGGRVELSSLRWSLWRLEVEVDNLTIHGLEAAHEVPYAHADRFYARLRIISLLGRHVGLRDLSIDHPVFHLIVNPDGTTNQPEPKVKGNGGGDEMQQLFDLEIERTEVRNGWLILNDRRTPLDGGADDVRAQMFYHAKEKRYDGRLRAGRIDVKLNALRPFSVEAETEFSLFRDYAQIHTLKMRSGATRLDAQGIVNEYWQPHLNVAYKLAVDLAELGRITRAPEMRGGMVEVTGSGHFWREDFNTSGKATLKDGAYSTPGFSAGNVGAGLEFSANPERIEVPHLFFHILGGAVQGRARVTNWRNPKLDAPHSRGVKRPEEDGRVDLDINGASLNALFAAISNPNDLPLDTLNTVGSLSGKANVHWAHAAHSTVVALDVDVTPPALASPGQLPVSAHAEATYRQSVLRIDHLTLATPASHLEASGTLGVAGENVRVTADTKNLGEVMPLIDALRPPGPMAVEFRGESSFDGTAYGRLSWPTFDGQFRAANFGVLVPRPGPKPTSAAADQQAQSDVLVVWDNVAADVVYDSTQAVIRHGVLRRGESELRLDANTRLEHGKLSDDFPVTAHFSLKHGDAGDLQRLFGYNYPVTGKLDAEFHSEDLVGGSRGGGRFTLSDGTAYGQSIKTLGAEIGFEGAHLRASKVALRSELGSADGEGDYDFDTSTFHFALHGEELRLDRMPYLNAGKLHAAGKFSIVAKGSGTMQAPLVSAAVRVHDLVINQQAFGGLNVDAVTRGSSLQLTARSNFQNANVALDGEILMRGEMPGRAVLTISSGNLNPLLAAFLPARMTGPTLLSARVEASGPMRRPEDLKIEIVADQVAGELEKIGIQNQGPIRMSIANRELSVEQFRLGGEGNRFFELSGKMEIAGQRRMNLTATGSVNLKLLQTSVPEPDVERGAAF
jgi:translocation and assembly module TamB